MKQIWQWLRERPWVFVIIVAALLPLTWFGNAKLITGADINFPLDPIARFTGRMHLWDTSFIAGRDQSVALPTQVFAFVQVLFHVIGFSLTFVEKFELVFWVAAIGSAIAFFLYELTINHQPVSRRWAVTLGTTAFIFNLFFINRVNEIDVATLGAMVSVPALLGFMLTAWNNRLQPWRAAIGAALTSIIGIGLFANPPLVLVIIFFVAGFVAVQAATRTRADNLRFAKFSGFFLAAFGLLHVWWILPFLGSIRTLTGDGSDLGGLNLLSWVDGLSRHTSFWNVLKMQGAWDWYEKGIGGVPYVPVASLYQQQPILKILSVILPVAAVASTVTGWRSWTKNQRGVGAFMLLALVISLVYSMGTYNTFSRFVYSHTAQIVPYFSLVRSPWYKFGFVTIVAYSVLLAFLTAWIAERIQKKWYRSFVLGLLTLAIVAYAFPLAAGSRFLFPYTRLKTIPDYLHTAANYLNQQPDTHRLVTLPQESAYDYTWGYGSGGDVLADLIRRPILSNETFAGGHRVGADALLASFYNALYQKVPDATRLLDYLDASRFLHKNDSKVADYSRTDDSAFIRNRISAQSDIKKTQTFGEWDIYERATPPPGRITTSTRVWTLFSDSLPSVLADLPQFLHFVPNDGQPTSFYLRPLDAAAGPHSSRSVFIQSFPYLKDGNPVQRIDFNGPFTGPATSHEIVGSNRKTVELNEKTVSDGSQVTFADKNVLETSTAVGMNRLSNPSFTADVPFELSGSGKWQFSDASQGTAGSPNFSIQRVAGSDSSPAIELKATDHILAMCQEVPDPPLRTIVRLQFDYRHVSGQAPSFAVTQDGNNLVLAGKPLESSNQWQTATMFVEMSPTAQRVSACLYAGAKPGETTVNQYDNVRLQVIGYQSTLGFFSEDTATTAPPSVSYHQVSATEWAATVQPSSVPFMLTFLESYNPGWVASVSGKAVPANQHVEIDTYANGWWLDPSDHVQTVTIRYAPQQTFVAVTWVSALAGIAAVVALVVFRRQKNVLAATPAEKPTPKPRVKRRKSTKRKVTR